MNVFNNNALSPDSAIDVTAFQASGGCSCKLPSDALKAITTEATLAPARAENHETDDAAFVALDDGSVLISSVDFQNPILPDAYLSGKIAALNALSDIFACGAKPMWADVVLALPRVAEHEQVAMGQRFMTGLAEVCASVDCNIVGGHTVVLETPLVGLAVRSVAHSDRIKKKSGAAPGDVVFVTKPVGNGVAVAARQSGFLQDDAWKAAEGAMLSANSIGAILGLESCVTSLTDVTGFGLLGHAVEVGDASDVCIELNMSTVPLLPGVKRAAGAGHVPMLANANWESFEESVECRTDLSAVERMLLADPQTNGGLLITASPEHADHVKQVCAAHGVTATIIGCVGERVSHPCRIVKG